MQKDLDDDLDQVAQRASAQCRPTVDRSAELNEVDIESYMYAY